MIFFTRCNWRAVFFLLVLGTASLGGISPARGAVYLLDESGVSDEFLGFSASELEDLDGDGHWELLIGQPGFPGAQNGGRVLLRYGGTSLTVAPDASWTGVIPERFGFSVARIGDVNNGGKPDWAVGAPTSNNGGSSIGQVYVFLGETHQGASISNGPDIVIGGEVGGDQFGYSISAAGDFDDDGYDDFIVGAPYNDARAQNAGAAYVIYGRSGGPSTDLAAATRFTGQIAEDNFGWSVTDVGNFLSANPNEVCVAVGAPFNNTHGGLDAGAVYVYQGELAGAEPDTAIDFVRGTSALAKPNSSYGWSVKGVGRWDNDSYPDLAVGAPTCNENGSQAGRVEIYYGGTSPSQFADRYVNGEFGTDQFGYALARIWDVSGSSADDLLIGAPFFDQTATDGGRAYIYEGGDASHNSASSLGIIENIPLMPGTEAGDHFGFAVSSAGDFDNDGTPDFAVGAPVGNIGNNATAGFLRLYDSSLGAVPALMRNWSARWTDSGHAGTGPAVELSFDLALPAVEILDIEIHREEFDDTGMVLITTRVWSGPAVPEHAALPGELADTGQGYRLEDRVALREDAAGISYAVTATRRTGDTVTLDHLEGPGPLPSSALPGARLSLAAAWPNPANPAVTIKFRAEPGRHATVRILDLSGKHVANVFEGTGTGDWQEVTWRGNSDDGRPAASGVYLIQLDSEAQVRHQRLVLAR